MDHPPGPPRAHLVRELVPFVLLVCACGAAVTRTSEPSQPAAGAPPPSPAASASSPTDPAAFDALAARGSTVAPGMSEAARREGGNDPVALVTAEGRDTCLRVAFEATAPVKARLVDAAGNVLAATTEASTDGVLAARGPVCVRRGDVVRGIADGAGARVRWMAWEAR
jgi:hypothetical protein